MKRAGAILTSVALLSFVLAPPAFAGGGEAPAVLQGKVTGPAVTATIVLDPSGTTASNDHKGEASIRVQKGTAVAGANFQHIQASLPAENGSAWVLGCDGTRGAVIADASWNVNTLTAIRFVNHPLTNWMLPAVKDTILYGSVASGGLGLTFDPKHPVAGITDVDNPVCTTLDAGTDHERVILSFTAVIQFAQGAL